MVNKGIVGVPLFHAQRFELAAALFILSAIGEKFQQAGLEISVGSHSGFTKLNAYVAKMAHGKECSLSLYPRGKGESIAFTGFLQDRNGQFTWDFGLFFKALQSFTILRATIMSLPQKETRPAR